MTFNMRRKLVTSTAVVLLCGMIAFVVPLPLAMAAPKPDQNPSPTEFSKAMRKLWEDHITWTRLYIISAASDLPDKDATTQRLLQNQTDIGNAIAPFYGNAAGAKLTALLKDHILGAAALIDAAKSGDKAKTDAAAAKWYANGDSIAVFLSTANPTRWPLAEMRAGMKMHLDLTLAEATDRLQGHYAADVQDYDKIHAHILGLADLLSSGIIQEFPAKFESKN
jgi:hypothetical protein